DSTGDPAHTRITIRTRFDTVRTLQLIASSHLPARDHTPHTAQPGLVHTPGDTTERVQHCERRHGLIRSVCLIIEFFVRLSNDSNRTQPIRPERPEERSCSFTTTATCPAIHASNRQRVSDSTVRRNCPTRSTSSSWAAARPE